MKTEEKRSIDLSLESYEEKDGRFFFTAKSLSSDFECEEGLKRLARASINKHLIWRHRHPIDPQHKENHIYGQIMDAHLENGYIVSTYEAYTHTPDHLAFIDLVKERKKAGDDLGISMHYRRYYNDNNEVIHYDVFEHSGTPIPSCTTCKTLDIGVKTMVNEEKKPEVKEEVKEEEPEEDSEVLEKIEELEKLLNDKTEKLESYKTKIESLELEMKKKSEEIQKKEDETKTVEERVLELETQIDYLKKKPFLDKLLEITDIDENQLKWLKTQDKSYIEKRYKDAEEEAESKPHTKTVEESADENINKTDKEFEEKEGETKNTFEEFTKYLKLNNNKK
jgi:hypothetical protein